MFSFPIFKITFFLLFILLITQNLYSQSLLTKPIEKLKGVNNRSDDKLLISVKTGYHTGYQKDMEHGFNGGMIFGANIDAPVTSETYLGLSFEYWHHTDDNYNSIIDIHSRTFTGTNFSFNASKRFEGRFHSFNIGLGGGMYFVKKEDKKLGDSKRDYFNIKLMLGLDIKIAGFGWLSSQIEYNNMVNFDKTVGMFNFKIGPTLVL